MPTFTKINGTWQEGTPYVKDSGAWKEIGAVTAKANGKWADIKPTIPVRTWVRKDFMIEGADFLIKPEIRQYFIIGDSINLDVSTLNIWGWASTPIPGITVTSERMSGTITGGVGLKDVGMFDNKFGSRILCADGTNIPIKLN